MKIEMIKKFIDGDNMNFIFNVDSKKIQVEIGGTAFGMLIKHVKHNKVKTQDEVLEEVMNNFDFVQFIENIYPRLNFGDNKIKIVICSNGVNVDGINVNIMSFENCKKFVTIE